MIPEPGPKEARRSRWKVRVATGLLLAALGGVAMAQPAPDADQVKAAYLHKFAGYVDWPAAVFANASAPFVYGVVGSERIYAELARLVAGRTVQGRSIEVRRLTRTDEVANLHVLFVGKESGASVVPVLAAYKGRPVLTVTELPIGLDAGAVLNFVEGDNRVRFEAAPAAADQVGLKLSSRLLAVAERVAGANP